MSSILRQNFDKSNCKLAHFKKHKGKDIINDVHCTLLLSVAQESTYRIKKKGTTAKSQIYKPEIFSHYGTEVSYDMHSYSFNQPLNLIQVNASNFNHSPCLTNG